MVDQTATLAAPPKVRVAECANCGGKRNCDIRGVYSEDVNDDHVWNNTQWFTLSCRGCDYVFVQTVSINSEEYYYEQAGDGSDELVHIETERYWPALSKREKPRWLSDIGIVGEGDEALSGVLIELYGALDNDLRLLAAIGVRTAFDVASELLGVDPLLPFNKKLDALVGSGQFKAADRDRLETLIEGGSASAHRGWRPTPKHLNIMMDVLQHFVEEAFVAPDRKKRLDDEVAKVKGLVPPKPQRAKKAKAVEPAE